MARFVLAFRGGMPKTPEEGQKMMEEWTRWSEGLGTALVDKGAGFGKSRWLMASDKQGRGSDPLSGYTVVEAADIEAALDLARPNPIFSLGGSIEVAEAMQM
ncbi:MAG: hypothetical protein HWE23_10380 [Rhodobacteraceae bacterium]|nr:hypothetical protein [Paracoccaceae bacterium]